MGRRHVVAPSRLSVLALFFLRLAIGWHFTYEAYAKLSNPRPFSAKGYLTEARGPLAGGFRWLAETSWALATVNVINTWGMLVLGIAFMLGLVARVSGGCLMLLLASYYLAMPPWTGIKLGAEEGSYLFVNKNLIELIAIGAIIASGVSRTWGLDGLIRARLEPTISPTGDAPANAGAKET